MKIHLTFLLYFVLLASPFTKAQNRIISLAPSLTQNLYLLDAAPQIIGYTTYCEEAVHSNKEIVATAVKVNLEKVVSLQPDLIISTTITNPETLEQLKKFGIRVEIYPTPTSFNAICAQFIAIGELIGKKEKAQQVVRESKHQVDSLREVMSSLPKQNMFFQIGSSPLYCVPPGSFMDDFMTFANGKNIASTPGNGHINRETVAVRNPEVFFLTAMGIIGEDEKEIWMRYPEISAIKKQKIYLLDSNKSCSPTPVTFVETLDTIAQLLR